MRDPQRSAQSFEILYAVREVPILVAIINVFARIAARRPYPSYFRSGGFSITLSKILLRRCRMRLIKNQGHSSEHFKDLKV